MKVENSSKCMYIRKTMSSKSYHKIITRESDDVDTIKRIIESKKPEMLILESGKGGLCNQLRMNQKTYWIAQNLASDGWKIDKLKYYNRELLKIVLSPKTIPEDALRAEGFEYRAESLGMGSNIGSIAEQPCFEMKTQTEPSADVWGALQGGTLS